jgi:membrane associated rhomboid family serine protease
LLLPHARVLTLVFVFLPLPVSAGFFLVVWFLLQLWESNFSMTHPEQSGGVAFAAHVGGFVFGLIAVRAFQVRPPLGPRRR